MSDDDKKASPEELKRVLDSMGGFLPGSANLVEHLKDAHDMKLRKSNGKTYISLCGIKVRVRGTSTKAALDNWCNKARRVLRGVQTA